MKGIIVLCYAVSIVYSIDSFHLVGFIQIPIVYGNKGYMCQLLIEQPTEAQGHRSTRLSMNSMITKKSASLPLIDKLKDGKIY
jgi:hypothetical protein